MSIRPRPEERTPAARFHLESAIQHGVDIETMPDGRVTVCHHPNAPVIVYDKEKGLGSYLSSIVIDAGGRWRLQKIS